MQIDEMYLLHPHLADAAELVERLEGEVDIDRQHEIARSADLLTLVLVMVELACRGADDLVGVCFNEFENHRRRGLIRQSFDMTLISAALESRR